MNLPGNMLASIGAAALALSAFGLQPQAAAGEATETWAPFADLLSSHVEEHDLEEGGLISSFDYRAAIGSDRAGERVRRQREILAGYDVGRINSRESALAFWINAYNFFMIAHILDNPVDGEPIESVRDYGSLFNPYRVFDRKLFNIGGTDYSLRQIEIDVLLGEDFAAKGWKDARVHFAVNCASVGCPPLRDRPYTAGDVDALLAENTRRALNTPLHLYIDGNTLWLTSLFDWYADDFVGHSGSVRDFIDQHVAEERAGRVEQTEDIRFIDYDWRLNSPENVIK